MVTRSAALDPITQLYRQHHRWLLGWLRARTGGGEVSADLAQDTFERLLRRPLSPDELRVPRAFLSTVARGLLINHWRRCDLEAAYLEAIASLPEPLYPSAEARACTLQLLLKIDVMLSGLPARPRQAFLMARLEGLAYAEIARELGVSERMVKNYLAQTLLHCLRLEQEAQT